MTLIDIGNRVFDRLVDAHGEDPTDRLSFFNFVLAGQPWTMAMSKSNPGEKIQVSQDGVNFAFEDSVLAQINVEILEQKRRLESEELAAKQEELQRTRKKAERVLKDGAIYNFWEDQSNNTTIEIKW